MEGQHVPTLGQVMRLLEDLGFTRESAKPGVLAFGHPPSGAEFLFRDRDPGLPARESEIVNLRVQLTLRGLMSEAEFTSFLTGATQPAS